YTAENSNISHQSPLNTAIPLTSNDLNLLPPKLVRELNQAAIAVDAELIEKLITQIPISQQYIAHAISQMLNNYDFDAIIALTNINSG
ncbi:MAG: hybrid sensor histidine kinase/response regulator, partial [Waterburya sp.]